MPTIEDVYEDFQNYWHAAMHSMTELEAAIQFLDENEYYHLQAQDLAEYEG